MTDLKLIKRLNRHPLNQLALELMKKDKEAEDYIYSQCLHLESLMIWLFEIKKPNGEPLQGSGQYDMEAEEFILRQFNEYPEYSMEFLKDNPPAVCRVETALNLANQILDLMSDVDLWLDWVKETQNGEAKGIESRFDF